MKALRLAAGLSQEKLSDLMSEIGLGWRRQTVALIESGSRAVTLDEVVALAALFEVSLYGLLHSPSGKQDDIPIRLGERAIPRGKWAALIADRRLAPFVEPAGPVLRGGIDEVVGGLDRPWARIWRERGGSAVSAYAESRDEVLEKRGRLPGPIFMVDEQTTISTVIGPWSKTIKFTLRPGEVYLPRDESELAAIEQAEQRGAVRRITRQQAYRIRRAHEKEGDR
jgi:transcriptional regulator with XRE-family HTH domain